MNRSCGVRAENPGEGVTLDPSRYEETLTMDDEETMDDSGAYAFKPLLEKGLQPPPEEFTNPAGVSRGECDTAEGADADPDCALEVTAQIEDLVLEETKPGYGIEGFEGEEVGGG